MFTVIIDKFNGTNSTIVTNSYADAICYYRDAIKHPVNRVCKLREDGFIIESTDPLDHIFPINYRTCVGVKLRHTNRGVRAFVVRFVWDEPDDDLGLPGVHISETITSYDAATMYGSAV